MELSPALYRFFVRPKWFSNFFFRNILKNYFDFENKVVLDFGCGIGSSSSLFEPAYYIGVDCNIKRIEYAKKIYPHYKFTNTKDNKISDINDNSVDYVLVMSVLHHISSDDIMEYLQEYKRVLKDNGTIIISEPCFLEGAKISNWIMKLLDKGEYIRNKQEYIKLFNQSSYDTNIIKSYNQYLFYNKLFFTATPKL